MEIRDPGDLAMNASGTALYLASGIGLEVFEPEPATGELNHVQLLESDFDLAESLLLWDSQRNRLLADDCGTWRAFAPVDDGEVLEDVGDLTVTDDTGRCATRLLMDVTGSSLYRVTGQHLEHFDFEDAGGLRFVQETDVGNAVYGAVLSSAGEYLYAVSNRLLVFERDLDSGELTQADFVAPLNHDRFVSTPPPPLAITNDDAYLFVFDNYGARANLFSLEDPLNPERLSTLSQFWNTSNPRRTNRCRFADVRGEAPSVDVFCPGLAYAARWDTEAGRLAGTDWIGERQGDRFNGIPAPDYGPPTGFAVGPDDRYVYLSTPGHGILTFGRGAPLDDASTGPELVVDTPSVNNASPAGGAAFTLSATVRNRGAEESATTTLRFYRSADALIASDDTEVGSTSVVAIAASATSDHSIDLTAPDDAGTYHYGGCVDSVTDEANVGNNCSASVAITVAGGVSSGDPDLVVESPSVSDESPAPGDAFTLSVVVRNQGDGAASGTTLRYYRSANATITMRDTEVGTDTVVGIAASASSNQSIDLTAPNDAGTYHYGACVDDLSNESDVENNCSAAVTITVAEDSGSPDLVVRSPAVDDASPDAEGAFTFSATVANDGDGRSAATTLRYYRSNNSIISTLDTEVGTDMVAELDSSGTVDESIDLSAPEETGTYHYGACVDAVTDESDDNNNCSDAVAIVVGGDEDSYCRDGDTVPAGGECDIYDTNFTFDVSASGRGCIQAGGISLCASGSHNYRNSTFNGVTITFVAERNDDLSWAIENVEPEPSD